MRTARWKARRGPILVAGTDKGPIINGVKMPPLGLAFDSRRPAASNIPDHVAGELTQTSGDASA
ncbi:msr5986 [Mesorhizobium japonicum MAFF 303099]|uniref:Msr5986 protein n=1 Tax=Mesorhizobium japonicum (strain LMG 29417 / CECT 9101 / MAFF 303099) TaxID=266835 RepID=Q98AI5_RHILO|nr:msr5986 [Mesorhizobium japonicum MAFF 303099]